MTELARTTRAGAGTLSLVQALADARDRTLALVAPYPDELLERQFDSLMSPLVWDLAHIAAYEDLWIGHRLGGLDLLRADLAAAYDAFETPRCVRGSIPLLGAREARDYLAAVRERAVAVVDDPDHEFVELVLRHELQHTETMLQAVALAGLPRPGGPHWSRPAARNGSRPPTGLDRVPVPGGPCELGSAPDGFAFDNERPARVVDVPAFAIGRHPVTNASFLSFVEGGGYERREWWSSEAWAWKEEHDITHPGPWRRGAGGEWVQRCVGGEAPLDPAGPVAGVSWFEADAFARAHGARLPTEPEWEKAATWDHGPGRRRAFPWGEEPPRPGDRRANLDQGALGPAEAGGLPAGAAACGAEQMLGDVWEWTASSFEGYPGFVAHPYREYSEVFFGRGYRVLRGGSWATRTRVATPAFRNWDLPERRQLFAGLRLAWDA